MKINHGILTYGDVSATCPTFLLDSAQHVEGFGVGGFFDAVKVAPGEEGRDLLWMVAFIAGLTDLAAAFVVILAPISAKYGIQGLAMASATHQTGACQVRRLSAHRSYERLVFCSALV